MKVIVWIGWLMVACLSISEARYKIRRPLPPSPPRQMFKKTWPISHRMSPANPIHIGGNFPHKRAPYKPANLRVRRPPVFNGIPNSWKTQSQMLGVLNNYAVLPQRPPVKEFHAINKVTEFSPEYRPESGILPPTHRGGIDDDKGPIHTIPAPNLSPADKPYNLETANREVNIDYSKNIQGTSVTPQKTVTSPTPHHYEVTETNEINSRDYYTVQPTFYTPQLDSSRLPTAVASDVQADEVLLKNQPALNTGLIGTNVQFGQLGSPMQTNLHSSLHVGFPGTAVQATSIAGDQVSDLHVGHPAAAGPPLSATQLYDLLNSFPQQLTDQYASGQHPQLQQHILQQQLGHLLQPTANGAASFNQPQMHSFNYDEQANKYQKQQQVSLGQNYAPGRVAGDYLQIPSDLLLGNNLRQGNDAVSDVADATDQHENRIEYEQSSNNQRNPSTYFTKIGTPGSISSQFYTTLPNREAAEKLAALAAAGNVNSQLIGQLRKQQEMRQNDAPMPSNHKEDAYEVSEEQDDNGDVQYDQKRYEEQQQQQQRYFQRQKQIREQYQSRREQELNSHIAQQRYNQQQQQLKEEKRRQSSKSDEKQGDSLKIMVPEVDEYREGSESANLDYDYENDEPTDTKGTLLNDENEQYETHDAEFGTRLETKTTRS